MSKIAVLGDLHIGIHKGNPVFEEALKYFIEDLFIPTLVKEGITEVIQLGDLVDRPTVIRYLDMVHLRNNFIEPLMDAGVNLHVLVGNHDVPFNRDTLTPSAPVELLNGYPIRVYDRPCETVIAGLPCVMLPWICRDNADTTFNLTKRTKCKVVFAHLELNDFQMYKGVTCKEGMDPSIFKDFSLVCSGHFHQPNSKGIIHYLGAPMQFTWADAGCARGFWILDTDTLELRFIQNRNDMFVLYTYENGVFSSMDVKNKYVKVYAKEIDDRKRFDAYIRALENAGAIEVKVNENEISLVSLIEVDDTKYEVENDERIFHDYIEAIVDSKLNKNKLESIILNARKEALLS